MKLTPQAPAHFSSVSAYSSGLPPDTASGIATGVTEMRLLTIGMPYFSSISSPVLTRCSALRQTFS